MNFGMKQSARSRRTNKNDNTMSKNYFVWLMIAVAAMTASCDNKSSRQTTEEAPDSVAVDVAVGDSTLYGVCGDGSAMNTLQLITDEGDTVVLSITDANDNGLCFGGFQSGDRMAVILKDGSTAGQVINLSALQGDWVTGGSETGISLKEGGIAESIGDASVEYSSWRLLNGKLEIERVRDGETESALYDIVSIGPDSLVFKDSSKIYKYSRK